MNILICFKFYEIWFARLIKDADHEFEIRIGRSTTVSELGVHNRKNRNVYLLKILQIS
jgi:hypothetical protein